MAAPFTTAAQKSLACTSKSRTENNIPIDLQQAQANAHVASLKTQAPALKQYRTAKSSTLSALQVNKFNYDLARVLAGHMDGLEGEISQEFQRQNPNHQTN